jgi:hypothetical protein
MICKHGEYLPPKLGDHDQASTNFVVANNFVRNEQSNNMSSSIAYFIPGCNRFYEKLRLKLAKNANFMKRLHINSLNGIIFGIDNGALFQTELVTP